MTVSNSTTDADDNMRVYLREGTNVTLSVCYIDNGNVKRCSLGQRGEA